MKVREKESEEEIKGERKIERKKERKEMEWMNAVVDFPLLQFQRFAGEDNTSCEGRRDECDGSV